MWIKHCTAFKHFFHAVRGPLTSAITSALQINCTCCTTSSCVDSFLFIHVFESTSLPCRRPCRRPNTPGRKTKTTHAVIENFVVKGKKERKEERKKERKKERRKQRKKERNYTSSGKKKIIVMNEWVKSHKSAYVECFSLSFQAWEDLLKFDTTAWNSYHWSIYCASVKVER